MNDGKHPPKLPHLHVRSVEGLLGEAIAITGNAKALVIDKRSNRTIAKQYGLHYSAVQRHRQHIPQLLVKAHEAEQVTQADELLMEVRRLGVKTLKVLHHAESTGELNTVLRGCYELD